MNTLKTVGAAFLFTAIVFLTFWVGVSIIDWIDDNNYGSQAVMVTSFSILWYLFYVTMRDEEQPAKEDKSEEDELLDWRESTSMKEMK